MVVTNCFEILYMGEGLNNGYATIFRVYKFIVISKTYSRNPYWFSQKGLVMLGTATALSPSY